LIHNINKGERMKKIEKDNVVIYSIEESEVNEISKEPR